MTTDQSIPSDAKIFSSSSPLLSLAAPRTVLVLGRGLARRPSIYIRHASYRSRAAREPASGVVTSPPPCLCGVNCEIRLLAWTCYSAYWHAHTRIARSRPKARTRPGPMLGGLMRGARMLLHPASIWKKPLHLHAWSPAEGPRLPISTCERNGAWQLAIYTHMFLCSISIKLLLLGL